EHLALAARARRLLRMEFAANAGDVLKIVTGEATDGHAEEISHHPVAAYRQAVGHHRAHGELEKVRQDLLLLMECGAGPLTVAVDFRRFLTRLGLHGRVAEARPVPVSDGHRPGGHATFHGEPRDGLRPLDRTRLRIV